MCMQTVIISHNSIIYLKIYLKELYTMESVNKIDKNLIPPGIEPGPCVC